MPNDREADGTPKPTAGMTEVAKPGQTGKVATTPGTGGGTAETGESGPGPATRTAGGGKDPNVQHDTPPSARDQ